MIKFITAILMVSINVSYFDVECVQSGLPAVDKGYVTPAGNLSWNPRPYERGLYRFTFTDRSHRIKGFDTGPYRPVELSDLAEDWLTGLNYEYFALWAKNQPKLAPPPIDPNVPDEFKGFFKALETHNGN